MRKGFLMALLAGLVAFSACEEEDKKTNDPMGVNGAWTCLQGSPGYTYESHRVFQGTRVTGEWMNGPSDTGFDIEGVFSFEFVDITAIGQNEYYVTMRGTYEEITLLTQDLVDMYNSSALYGISDWTINEARDITGKTYDNQTRGYTFTRIKIGEDGRMYYGKTDSTHLGTSPETRPVEYDTGWAWTRD